MPFEFRDAETTLAPGEGLFMFTDGVTEAHDAAGELYGEDRLTRVLSGPPIPDAERIVRQVDTEIDRFARDTEQADDITMLAVYYLGNSAAHRPEPATAAPLPAPDQAV